MKEVKRIAKNTPISIQKKSIEHTNPLQSLQPYLKKHEFIERVSLLDDEDPGSLLNNNSLKGFYNCLFVIAFFYFTTTPIIRYKAHGNFIDRTLFDSMCRDFFVCIISWPLFYIWLHFAFIQEKLIIKGYSEYVIVFIGLSKPLMMVYSIFIVLAQDLFLIHSIFITFHSCVFFMKMYAYQITNRSLREEWISKGRPFSKLEQDYPNNININNFTLWAWMPVLVYEPIFPRTKSIRLGYCIKKSVYVLSLMILDYIIVSESILPTLRDCKSMSFLESTSKIVLPCLVVWLVTFHLIWEDYMNFFGEITRFGDREFYQDWWNARNYEEFNRKWNKPVYEFLYRHIYLESIQRYKVPVKKAQFLTVLGSALFHEFCLAIAMRQLTPIMLGFMLIQLPVILYTRKMQKSKYENLFVWWGLIQGIPLILNLYLRADEIIDRGFDVII